MTPQRVHSGLSGFQVDSKILPKKEKNKFLVYVEASLRAFLVCTSIPEQKKKNFVFIFQVSVISNRVWKLKL